MALRAVFFPLWLPRGHNANKGREQGIEELEVCLCVCRDLQHSWASHLGDGNRWDKSPVCWCCCRKEWNVEINLSFGSVYAWAVSLAEQELPVGKEEMWLLAASASFHRLWRDDRFGKVAPWWPLLKDHLACEPCISAELFLLYRKTLHPNHWNNLAETLGPPVPKHREEGLHLWQLWELVSACDRVFLFPSQIILSHKYGTMPDHCCWCCLQHTGWSSVELLQAKQTLLGAFSCHKAGAKASEL